MNRIVALNEYEVIFEKAAGFCNVVRDGGARTVLSIDANG